MADDQKHTDLERRVALIEAFLDHEVRERQNLAQTKVSAHSSVLLPKNPWFDARHSNPVAGRPSFKTPIGVEEVKVGDKGSGRRVL